MNIKINEITDIPLPKLIEILEEKHNKKKLQIQVNGIPENEESNLIEQIISKPCDEMIQPIPPVKKVSTVNELQKFTFNINEMEDKLPLNFNIQGDLIKPRSKNESNKILLFSPVKHSSKNLLLLRTPEAISYSLVFLFRIIRIKIILKMIISILIFFKARITV